MKLVNQCLAVGCNSVLTVLMILREEDKVTVVCNEMTRWVFLKSSLSGVGNFVNLVTSLQEKQAISVLCPGRTRQAMYLTCKRNIEARGLTFVAL